MDYQKTYKWLNHVRASGYSEEQIKKELNKSGWSTEQINEILDNDSDLKYSNRKFFRLYPNNNYYNSRARKIGDFFAGFFGGIILVAIISFAPTVFSLFSYNSVSNIFYSIFSIVQILFYIALIFLCVKFFKNGRKYLGIGIISLVLIPLLAVGACLALFAGGSF